MLLYVGKKVADCQLAFLEDRLDDCQMFLHVFLDETEDGFPVIFWDILGLILIMVVVVFFPLRFYLFELPLACLFNTVILFLRVMLQLNLTSLSLLQLTVRLPDSCTRIVPLAEDCSLLDEHIVDGECPGELKLMFLYLPVQLLENHQLFGVGGLMMAMLGLVEVIGTLQHCMIYDQYSIIIIKLN